MCRLVLQIAPGTAPAMCRADVLVRTRVHVPLRVLLLLTLFLPQRPMTHSASATISSLVVSAATDEDIFSDIIITLLLEA